MLQPALLAASTLPADARHLGNVEVRPAELQVLIDGVRVGFTVREFELFLVLANRLDRVVPRAEIYELVWGGTMPRRDRSVDVFVRKVRHKLRIVAPGWDYVHSISASGTGSRPSGPPAGSSESSPSPASSADPDGGRRCRARRPRSSRWYAGARRRP